MQLLEAKQPKKLDRSTKLILQDLGDAFSSLSEMLCEREASPDGDAMRSLACFHEVVRQRQRLLLQRR